MSATSGTSHPGRRVYPNAEGQLSLAPGDYGIDPRDGHWYCRTPDIDGHMGNLAAHSVIEHEDKTITVSPSILVSDSDGPLWHGFLEKGIWREA